MENNWNGSAIAKSVLLPGIDATTTVLITGGSGAIGERTAEAFLGLGARVAIMSRATTSVTQTVERLDPFGEVLGITGDVSDQADAHRAVDQVTTRWNELDVLVQCAAVGGNGPLEELNPDYIDRMLSVNVKGTLLMAKAAAVPMAARHSGCIINVSSIVAHRSVPHNVLYSSSKAAVSHATHALAVELGPSGIRVNCVSPANTPTQVRQVDEAAGSPPVLPSGQGGSADRIPLRRRGELDDYVGPILFFASDLARYVTGCDVLADGGLALLRA